MDRSFFRTVEKLNNEHRRTRRWHKVITVMAAIVVFCTTYALILPAITWERHLLCGMEEHTHTEACYAEVEIEPEQELVCADPEHAHDDACYRSVPVDAERQLICDKPEHIHTDACFDAPPSVDSGYYCGHVEHTHNKYCYFDDGSLRCTMQEHAHTLSCRIDKNADLETAGKWERTFADVKLTDNWAQNVLAIANTQLGYTESKKNYTVTDETAGIIKGYTRYGAWYGDPYGDWCAMFCSFCIDYAGVKDFPLDSNCGKWIEALSAEERMLYYPAADCPESYMPQPGDLIFFNWSAAGQKKSGESSMTQLTDAQRVELIEQAPRNADHVGLVYELIEATDTAPARIKTIEGNNGNTVAYHTYDLDDVRILGYGQLPENPDYLQFHEITSIPASDGAVVTITGNLPTDAKATIELVSLSEKQLNTYIGEEAASAVNAYIAYDIKIMVDGKEWQPDNSVSVQIRHPDLEVKGSECIAAVHVDDVTHIASEVEKPVGSGDSISFTADGFSTYIFYTFTVDFHYGEATFSIEGRTEITLSELFNELGITRSVADVEEVTFSDESLVTVTKTENDWLLTSLEPFSTKESLVIRFTDGETYILRVTDAQSDISYWQKVTDLSDITTDDQYMIVSGSGYALGTDGTAFVGTRVTPGTQTVDGKTYYTVSGDTNTDYYRWKFGTAGKGGTLKNVADGGGLQHNNNFTDNTLTQQSNGSWQISYSYTKRVNYRWQTITEYLVCNNGSFETTTLSANADMTIYKLCEAEAVIPDGTVKDGSNYTFAVYLQQVDSFGHALGIPIKVDMQTVDSAHGSSNPLVPSALFADYGVNGTYVNAYYGTAAEKDKDGVTEIYQYSRSGTYYLGIVADGTTTNRYLSSSSDKALYIQYRVDSGDSGGDDVVKPTYPAYRSTSPAKTGDTGIGSVEGTYWSDAATSQLESQFAGVSADDGKVLTDKSVIYGKDDYGAFKNYEPNTFGVTLSALGQKYPITEEFDIHTPLDVVFVLDTSGSMIDTKYDGKTSADIMIESLNQIMAYILDQNEDNRVGVVCFSGQSTKLLDLGRYTAANNKFFDEGKCTAKDYQLTPSNSIQRTDGELYKGTFTAGWWGTYTQHGIAQGALEFLNNPDTTVTQTVSKETEDGLATATYTATRRPVFILLSDGEPTYCTEDYDSVLASTNVRGDGTATTTTNNQGIMGYYTILSAQYYKKAISAHYHTDTYFYTIGIGIHDTGNNSFANSVAGDDYKRAVLNPTAANVSHLQNCTGGVNEGDNNKSISGTTNTTCHELYRLLNDNQSGPITVGSHDRTSSAKYGLPVSTTSSSASVIKNPYKATGYSYADGAFFSANSSVETLAKAFTEAISFSKDIPVYGYILKNNSSVVVSDPIGEDMEVKSDLILRYGGQNYAPVSHSTEGNVTTYSYSGIYTAPDGSGATADISKITAQVITEEDGTQTVKLIVPDGQMPAYSPNLRSNGSAKFYYEALPVRLIYQVGLTEQAEKDIAALETAGGTKTYYTNRWDDSAYAEADYQPTGKNPYYNGNDYDKSMVSKVKNTTDTKPYSRGYSDKCGSKYVNQLLGNNGKLVFHNDVPPRSITIYKVDMQDRKIAADFAQFQLYDDADLTNLLGTYTTAEGEVTIHDLQVGTTYYLKESAAPDGYIRLEEAQAFTVDAEGNVTGMAANGYLSWDRDSRVLLVRNSDGYELPETGGIGTTLYILGGLLLMAGAAVYGYRTRRKYGRGDD